jgi:phosphoheptose isomerase
MTTKAKPLFYFNGIKFNTSFFDTEIDKTLKNYVNYDPTNTKLISNVNYIPTDITSLTLTTIGQNDMIDNMFNLPTNTFEASPKSILQLVNNSSRNTQWVVPATVITDYVNYSNPNLISNVSGTTTTISNLTVGPLICTTIQNNNNTLNCGNITSGSINSGSINANANLIQTTGNLQSRGLTIKNVSNVDVATISNLGALVCTTIQNNNNTLNCGNITSGTINSGSINANANLIETTGNLQSRGLSIKNVSNVDVATISNLGALVCTTIQNNNNTLNCGNITSGSINSGSINANANLIETTGSLQSRGISIRNVSNTESASISSAGNLIAKSLQSKSLNIKDVNNNDIATISTAGDLVCTTFQNNNNTLNCGNITSGSINSGSINANANLIETTGNLQSRGLSIRNVSNVDVATISNLGALVCTTIQNNNNTLNCGAITSGSINSGSINANANLIQTTGTVQSRGLSIKNVSNVDVATISNLGALVCTTIQNNNNTLNCGNITSGTINSGAITCTTISTQNSTINCGGGDVNAATITASVNLISTGNIVVKNGANNTVQIENSGQFICKNIIVRDPITLTQYFTVSPLGAIVGGSLNCTTITTNNSNITCGGGSISGATITASSNLVSNGGIIVNDGTNNTSTVQQDGQITCKNFLIRQPGTSNFPLSISVSGDVLGNGADFVRFQSTGLNIFNTLSSGVFGTLQASINNAGALSCKSITSNNNTISAGTGAISTTTLNSSTIGGVLDIGANQTTGALSIGNNAGRTGAINIATLTTGANSINIGNSASTQTININRPIRMPGFIYSSGNEIGYTQNDATIFSTATGNPTLSGTIMKTTITTTNLILNANYLIKYSLTISPLADFNVTKFSYGLCTTGFIPGNSNNIAVLSGTTVITSTRFSTTDTYSYSGSGFFRYNNPVVPYGFGYLIDYLATPPIIVTNIDLIRIS